MANEESASHLPDHPFQPQKYWVTVRQIKWDEEAGNWECRADNSPTPHGLHCSIFFHIAGASQVPHAGEILNVLVESPRAEVTPVEPPKTP